ncbi:MAG TPA: sigma-70 family RNA polymerase sigma factor [Verrucomicrobiae bacterium]|nr:sigma-70 family RNA polymerase sigma factor [Verrucomicrobiae bacterium]
MTSDSELLRRFAKNHSEDAFAQVVKRHVNLVYSAALRQVGGDAQLAQDAAQSVFADLARKAGELSRRQNLTGWLYTSAYFAAAKIARTENRRRDREEKFMRDPTQNSGTGLPPGQFAPEADWEKIRPALDDAMHELNETDRDAILFRYFENQPFIQVGAKLGLNENAARMRVERALEKLRAIFAKRGITTAAALASVISANAVQVAPATLGATLTTGSIAAAGTGTFTLMKIMSMTNLKLGIGALVVAGAATVMVVQHQYQTKLRDVNASLRQQIAQLKTESQGLSNRLASVGDAESLSDEQSTELARLRSEVAQMQTYSNQVARLRNEKAQWTTLPADAAAKILLERIALLKQRLDQMPEEKIPELRFLTLKDWMHAAELSDLRTEDDFLKGFSDLRASAKFTFGKMMQNALYNYAVSNDGFLPTNVLELRTYFKHPAPEFVLPILRRYELLQLGIRYVVTANGLIAPPTAFSPVTKEEEPFVLEKAPVDKKYDTRLEVAMGWAGPLDFKYYSYTNGIPPTNGSNSPSAK